MKLLKQTILKYKEIFGVWPTEIHISSEMIDELEKEERKIPASALPVLISNPHLAPLMMGCNWHWNAEGFYDTQCGIEVEKDLPKYSPSDSPVTCLCGKNVVFHPFEKL